MENQVRVIGAKGDPCTRCGLAKAQFIFATDETTLQYVCSFCEVGLADSQPTAPAAERASDTEVD